MKPEIGSKWKLKEWGSYATVTDVTDTHVSLRHVHGAAALIALEHFPDRCIRYTEPVMTERWVAVYDEGTTSDAYMDFNVAQNMAQMYDTAGILKLTFRDGKLVKAEVVE